MRSAEASDEMKKALVDDSETSVGKVVFEKPIQEASVVYSAIWRWIVMEILTAVNYRWKCRVAAGPQAMVFRENFFSILSSSDLAFTFALLSWGARRWVAVDELTGAITISPEDGGGE